MAIKPQRVEWLKLHYSKDEFWINRIVSVFADDTYISKKTWLTMLDNLPDDHLIYHLSINTGKGGNEVKIFCWDA